MSEKTKRDLGQFFTRDSVWLRPHIRAHIESLSNQYRLCVDPFAGDGHLLELAQKMGFEIQGHDIDENICASKQWGEPNDSIRRVIRHEQAFVLTNPPYLAKNSAKRMKSPMVEYFEAGFIPTLDDSRLNVLDDLFKLAIEQTLAKYDDSIWIVPEAGIQDLDDLPHWKDRLHSVTILEDNPFDDTEHPVCVMIFSASKPIQEIWKNDELLGKYDELKKEHDEFSKRPSKSIPMKFNEPSGVLGYRAVDGTREDGSMRIRFCREEELGYSRKDIKRTSRHMTYIGVNLHGDVLDATIERANLLIDEYRKRTHDVFLTAFMGNNKTGERRRRLHYTLARVLFNKSYLEVGQAGINMNNPFSETAIQSQLVLIRNQNLAEVKQAAKAQRKWLIAKITNHLQRWGIGPTGIPTVITKILSDDEFAKFFAKDPQKQSFHETYGQKEMKNVGLAIQNLPNSGKRAIYIHNGELKTGLSKKPEERIKSVDCRCQRKIKATVWEDFILQKWIGDEGGAQDNQFSDIRTFVEQANMYASVNKNNHRIIALIDGPYFSSKRIAALQTIVDAGNKDRVKVLSTHEYMLLH